MMTFLHRAGFEWNHNTKESIKRMKIIFTPGQDISPDIAMLTSVSPTMKMNDAAEFHNTVCVTYYVAKVIYFYTER